MNLSETFGGGSGQINLSEGLACFASHVDGLPSVAPGLDSKLTP